MLKTDRSYLVVSIFITFPVLLYLLFNNFVINLDSLGRMSGIAGLSALSISVIISARLKIFDKIFHGLDKMYRLHHTIGCFTLLLILLHFNLVLIKYSQLSLQLSFDLLLNFHDLYYLTAKLGLLILISGIIFSLYIKVSYDWFVKLMRIMGIVIFLGGYHAILVPNSDISKRPILFAYMIALFSIAMFIYIYRSIFHKSFNKLYEYTIDDIKILGDVIEIYMRPNKQALKHYAGQFAFVTFNNRHITNEPHPFTISSGSDNTILRLSVKQLGDFTKSLTKLEKGNQATLEGPYGQFSATKIGDNHQIWIAGGIGITPFLSMIQSVNKGIEVDLYYCFSNKSEAVYESELKKSTKNINIRLHLIDSSKTGYLKIDKIKDLSDNSTIMLCGPPQMMQDLTKQIINFGINKRLIHYEEFSLK